MKATLVYADGRVENRDDGGIQWIEVQDGKTARFFRACEVAHTATGQDGGALGASVMVYAEQPLREYGRRLVGV